MTKSCFILRAVGCAFRVGLFATLCSGLWTGISSSVQAQSILISSNSGSAIAQLYTNQSYSYNFGITTLGGGQPC